MSRRHAAGVGAAVAVLLVLMGVPATADAARVTSLKPWAASNEYLVTEDLEGARARRASRARRSTT